jgi:hypothetical protein
MCSRLYRTISIATALLAAAAMLMSGCSKDETVAPSASTRPSNPQYLMVKRTGFHVAEITWIDSGSAPTQYLVERATGNTQQFQERGRVPGTQHSFVDTFAVYGSYQYNIRPVTATISAQPYTTGLVSFGDPLPDVLTAREVRAGVLEVAWPITVFDLTGFLVLRSVDGGPYGPLARGGGHTFSIEDTLKDYGTYRYAVRVILGADTSVERTSNLVAITSPYLKDLQLTFDDDEVLLVSWTPGNPFASSFVIERSIGGAAWEGIRTLSRTASTFRDTVHQLGIHRYRVHAMTAASRSDDLETNALDIDGWFPGRPRNYGNSYGHFLPLPDHNLLFYGQSGAEVYRVGVRQWELVAGPGPLDVWGQPVVLRSGKILNLLGGTGASTPEQLPDWRNDIFDPASGAWQQVGLFKATLGPSTGVHAFALANGSAVVIGSTGRGAQFGIPPAPFVEVFNSATLSFESRTVGPNPGIGSVACPIAGEKILLAGGRLTITGAARDSCWLYDPAADSWSPTVPLPVSLEPTSMVSMQNGTRILVRAGGSTASYVYDVPSGTWEPGPAIPGSLVYAMTGVDKDTLFAICGDVYTPGSLYRYTASGNQWEVVRKFPSARMPSPWALRRLPDGRFLVLDNSSTRTEIFDPRLE